VRKDTIIVCITWSLDENFKVSKGNKLTVVKVKGVSKVVTNKVMLENLLTKVRSKKINKLITNKS